MPRHRSRRRPLTVALIAASVIFGGVSVAAPALADVPDAPADSFVAPLCDGSTFSDPQKADGDVSNLAQVFGQRLVDYNAGKTVVLYDVWGSNDLNGYPAVCGVRHVAGVGPVSEWMFCTDYFSHVCSGVDVDGSLLDIDGNAIPGLSELEDGNPRLTDAQQRLITALVTSGDSEYAGIGYFSFNGVTHAASDAGSMQRAALQVLVWCVSDPASPTATGTEAERWQTCEQNLDTQRRAELLASLPVDPTLELTGPTGPVTFGDPVEFTIQTDVFDTPLTLSTAGVTGTINVVSGPADLDGAQLTIAGEDAVETVTIQILPDAPGDLTLTVSAISTGVPTLTWDQSPGVAEDGARCQVFATSHAVSERHAYSSSATIVRDSDDKPDTDTPDTDQGTDTPDTDQGTDTPDADEGTDTPDTGEGTDTPDTDEGTDTPDTDQETDHSSSDLSEASESTQTELAVTGGNAIDPLVIMSALAVILLGGALLALGIRPAQRR